ncbi:alpha/beta fold hydrolase [Gordonia lacunae]|uniref:Epoxide hydrolase n=1 Tax=Gordonia lacunae TaxID=417102 RepID=A0A2C9ZJM4_9ACTN|nr:alpha/beta fold hydrolase [Gordonia lacunae]OUC80949.1 epoxide hydrolase [Gordonia lacunae]
MDTFQTDGLIFEVTDLGAVDDPTVVLLHGFPQDRTAWDEVGQSLADHGFRVLIPNLRGYSPEACPRPVSRYGLPRLVADVIALLDAAEVDSAHLVGHDWGGALVWTMRRTHPYRLRTATIVSTPHPQALTWGMVRTGQALRSWYMLALALPAVPEHVLTRHLARFLKRSGLSEDRANRYQQRMKREGVARGAVNWYRRMLFEQLRPPKHPRTSSQRAVPTVYIYGRDDPFFSVAVMRKTAEVARGVEVRELRGGHWLPESEPEALLHSIVRQVSNPSTD